MTIPILTAEAVAEMRARAERATPGPWRAITQYDGLVTITSDVADRDVADEVDEDDAAFFIASRAALSALAPEQGASGRGDDGDDHG